MAKDLDAVNNFLEKYVAWLHASHQEPPHAMHSIGGTSVHLTQLGDERKPSGEAWDL